MRCKYADKLPAGLRPSTFLHCLVPVQFPSHNPSDLPILQVSNRIAILSDRVANQIAAGEVVERPVAVVKELVENSLDAGASRVEVEFRNGGKSLIRVDDNGHGMSRDDALLALERHATSKIREAADINSVGTFGFRGEALPSIASVCRFTLKTRRAEDTHGTEVLVNGGKLLHVRETGMPTGTSVEVAHLFNSVPARRKFLKTDKTEAAHIIQLCRLLATAHPAVAFSLLEDGREVFRSPQCPSLRERVAEIFGGSVAEELMEIDASAGPLRLHGLIGKPGTGKATRQDMHTYVNLRPVDSRTLTYALIESYHTHLPKGRYPIAFLFLEIDPASVDVNVHPAKREVRFRDDPGVRQFVMRALIARLQAASASAFGTPTPQQTPAPSAPTPQDTTAQAKATELIALRAPDTKSKAVSYKTDTGPQSPDNRENGSANRAPEASLSPTQPTAHHSGQSKNQKSEIRNTSWRFLSFLHDHYALFETPAGLTTLNWKAAHERVLYEEILTSLGEGHPAQQTLLFPIALEFDPLTDAALTEHLDFIKQSGFELNAFGRQFYRLEAVPDWFDPNEAEQFVRDLAALLRERGLRPEKTDTAREQIARMAAATCTRRAALPKEPELKALLNRLFRCSQPLSDPKGRPTLIETPKAELARKFGLGL